ncbi:MAG: hypothetical protein OXG37_01840 [Actinomycetia bacterium]|nr:hypothetical protein [Actinomycetes bacterium]
MSSYCNPPGRIVDFTPRLARRAASRYRERGLDKAALRMVECPEQRGIEGATALGVGSGAGAIQIELLRRGVEHTVEPRSLARL